MEKIVWPLFKKNNDNKKSVTHLGVQHAFLLCDILQTLCWNKAVTFHYSKIKHIWWFCVAQNIFCQADSCSHDLGLWHKTTSAAQHSSMQTCVCQDFEFATRQTACMCFAWTSFWSVLILCTYNHSCVSSQIHFKWLRQCHHSSYAACAQIKHESDMHRSKSRWWSYMRQWIGIWITADFDPFSGINGSVRQSVRCWLHLQQTVKHIVTCRCLKLRQRPEQRTLYLPRMMMTDWKDTRSVHLSLCHSVACLTWFLHYFYDKKKHSESFHTLNFVPVWLMSILHHSYNKKTHSKCLNTSNDMMARNPTQQHQQSCLSYCTASQTTMWCSRHCSLVRTWGVNWCTFPCLAKRWLHMVLVALHQCL